MLTRRDKRYGQDDMVLEYVVDELWGMTDMLEGILVAKNVGQKKLRFEIEN